MRERGNVSLQVITTIGVILAMGATIISGYRWIDERFKALEDPRPEVQSLTEREPEAQPRTESTISIGIPIGTIVAFGGTREKIPEGWLSCNGKKFDQKEYQELFKVLGYNYNPDLVNSGSFALPNLNGRVPVGAGNGDKLSPRKIGKLYGNERHKLTVKQIPDHQHKTMLGTLEEDSLRWGSKDADKYIFGSKFQKGYSSLTNSTGGQESFEISQPSLVVNFIIKAK